MAETFSQKEKKFIKRGLFAGLLMGLVGVGLGALKGVVGKF